MLGMGLAIFGIASNRRGGGPALSLDFTTGVLPAGVTFTRASSGTYVNSSGLVAVASADVARFSYDPANPTLPSILIEPQRTSVVTHSQDSSAWSTADASLTASAATSPDGSTNATKLTSTVTGTSTGGVYINEGSASGTPSIAIFAKKGTYNWLGLSTGSGSWAYFNLDTGVVGSKANCTSRMVDWGNGWYRCIIETATSPGTYVLFAGKGLDTGTDPWGTNIYTTSGDYIYVWQVDRHAVSPMTSPIITSGATATRSADVLSFTIPAGIGTLTYTFDDASTQVLSVTPGAYTVPTNLNRSHINTIEGAT